MKLTPSLRSAIATEILAAMSNGSSVSPKLEIYDGTEPSNMGETITDTMLTEHDLIDAVGSVSGGTITFGTIAEDTSANASGDAGWARILDRAGAEVMYLTVTAAGSGGNIQLNSVSISSGLAVSITSGTFTVGGA